LTEHRSLLPMRLALPWWDAALRSVRDSGESIALPAVQWLQVRAARRYPLATTWRDWLLENAGLGQHVVGRFPAGPCARRAANDGDAAGHWAVAQPVHLAAAIDHLRLVPLHELAITEEEATALHATIRGHLAGTGFDFECDAPERWALRCRDAIESSTFEPMQVVGQNVRDFMPAGRDGPAIRSLMNEIQMLLHEHPVNERRARERRPTINSLWLWGFGAAPPVARQVLPPLASDDPWLDGLWSLHGQRAVAVGNARAMLAGPEPGSLVAVSLPPTRSCVDSLRMIDAGLLDAACGAIRNGRCRSLEICLGSTVVALDAVSRWRFWRSARSVGQVLA
jgi:hypothetical protein